MVVGLRYFVVGFVLFLFLGGRGERAVLLQETKSGVKPLVPNRRHAKHTKQARKRNAPSRCGSRCTRCRCTGWRAATARSGAARRPSRGRTARPSPSARFCFCCFCLFSFLFVRRVIVRLTPGRVELVVPRLQRGQAFSEEGETASKRARAERRRRRTRVVGVGALPVVNSSLCFGPRALGQRHTGPEMSHAP